MPTPSSPPQSQSSSYPNQSFLQILSQLAIIPGGLASGTATAVGGLTTGTIVVIGGVSFGVLILAGTVVFVAVNAPALSGVSPINPAQIAAGGGPMAPPLTLAILSTQTQNALTFLNNSAYGPFLQAMNLFGAQDSITVTINALGQLQFSGTLSFQGTTWTIKELGQDGSLTLVDQNSIETTVSKDTANTLLAQAKTLGQPAPLPQPGVQPAPGTGLQPQPQAQAQKTQTDQNVDQNGCFSDRFVQICWRVPMEIQAGTGDVPGGTTTPIQGSFGTSTGARALQALLADAEVTTSLGNAAILPSFLPAAIPVKNFFAPFTASTPSCDLPTGYTGDIWTVPASLINSSKFFDPAVRENLILGGGGASIRTDGRGITAQGVSYPSWFSRPDEAGLRVGFEGRLLGGAIQPPSFNQLHYLQIVGKNSLALAKLTHAPGPIEQVDGLFWTLDNGTNQPAYPPFYDPIGTAQGRWFLDLPHVSQQANRFAVPSRVGFLFCFACWAAWWLESDRRTPADKPVFDSVFMLSDEGSFIQMAEVSLPFVPGAPGAVIDDTTNPANPKPLTHLSLLCPSSTDALELIAFLQASQVITTPPGTTYTTSSGVFSPSNPSASFPALGTFAGDKTGSQTFAWGAEVDGLVNNLSDEEFALYGSRRNVLNSKSTQIGQVFMRTSGEGAYWPPFIVAPLGVSVFGLAYAYAVGGPSVDEFNQVAQGGQGIPPTPDIPSFWIG